MALPKVWMTELQDEKQKEARLARLEQMETQIFERASGVLDAVLSFYEVTPHQTEPPQAWIDEYGLEGAQQRLVVARSGHLPPSLMPNGTKLAAQLATGILRSRGYRATKAGAAPVNATITLPSPTSHASPHAPVYERKEIE